jgi:hypothetical protein
MNALDTLTPRMLERFPTASLYLIYRETMDDSLAATRASFDVMVMTETTDQRSSLGEALVP